MKNTLSDHLPVLIQVIIGLALPVVILAASHVFGQRARRNANKDSAYECGVPAPAPLPRHYKLSFQTLALLFLLFEVEVILLLPPILAFREFAATHLETILPLFAFLGLIALGIAYETRTGALNFANTATRQPRNQSAPSTNSAK